jgi:crotonobetainyl-CoA:carnitine CoA-transferase CaiB-like acyl-CoA transferase
MEEISQIRKQSNFSFRLTGRPCYDIYETKEGHISVGCLEPHFWKSFVQVLNLKELSPLENAFATGEKGRKVKSIITQVLKTKSASEVFFM